MRFDNHDSSIRKQFSKGIFFLTFTLLVFLRIFKHDIHDLKKKKSFKLSKKKFNKFMNMKNNTSPEGSKETKHFNKKLTIENCLQLF